VLLDVDVDRARNLAPEAHFGKGLDEGDAGLARLQRLYDLILGVPDAGNCTETRHDHSPHCYSS
jgi:hypothetical protein